MEVNNIVTLDDLEKDVPRTYINPQGEVLYRILYKDTTGHLHALYVSEKRLREIEDFQAKNSTNIT